MADENMNVNCEEKTAERIKRSKLDGIRDWCDAHPKQMLLIKVGGIVLTCGLTAGLTRRATLKSIERQYAEGFEEFEDCCDCDIDEVSDVEDDIQVVEN